MRNITTAEAAVSAVLVFGFISGIFAHVQLITGYDVSSIESQIVIALNATCRIFNSSPFNSSPYMKAPIKQCFTNLLLAEVLAAISSIASIIYYIKKVGNIIDGAILYVIGFVIGFVLLYL